MKKTAVLVCFCLAGCGSLLPRSDAVVEGPWQSYHDAQLAFEKIVPYQTTVEDLKAIGMAPSLRPNITILNYSDVVRRFIPSPLTNPEELDDGVRDCIKGKTACTGLEIDQASIKRIRSGGFWADFLNFKRKVDVTGWRFSGMLLIKDNIVVYKLIGGQPLIHELEHSKNPLGPLQDIGGSSLRSML